MKKNKVRLALNLKEGDHIETAWAKFAAGPGWANQPLWVLIKRASGKYEVACLQPEEYTPDVRMLYAISNVVCDSMTAAVCREAYK